MTSLSYFSGICSELPNSGRNRFQAKDWHGQRGCWLELSFFLKVQQMLNLIKDLF